MSPFITCMALLPLAAPAADLTVQRLEARKVGDVTYFRVTLKAPADLALPEPALSDGMNERGVRRRGQWPRLVPLDEHSRAVVLDVHHLFVEQTTPRSLRFVGQRLGTSGPARLRLIYPIATKPKAGLAGLPSDANVATAEVTLDLAKAETKTDGAQLRASWAKAQAHDLESQHLRSP